MQHPVLATENALPPLVHSPCKGRQRNKLRSPHPKVCTAADGRRLALSQTGLKQVTSARKHAKKTHGKNQRAPPRLWRGTRSLAFRSWRRGSLLSPRDEGEKRHLWEPSPSIHTHRFRGDRPPQPSGSGSPGSPPGRRYPGGTGTLTAQEPQAEQEQQAQAAARHLPAAAAAWGGARGRGLGARGALTAPGRALPPPSRSRPKLLTCPRRRLPAPKAGAGA